MKRALLVGIDDYRNFAPLTGCVNDVGAILPLFSRNDNDSPNFETKTLTSGSRPVTRDDLLERLDHLLSGVADISLFYFAGHGAESADDVILVMEDGTSQSPGVSLSEILSRTQQSEVREVVIILDCCFSGAAGGIPQLGSSAASLRPGLSILTASRGDQASAETNTGRGVFSTYLEGGLAGGAADVVGRVTVAGLYAYLSESFGAWEQRPTFKANIDRLNELRGCEPAVPLELLRTLPSLFPQADYTFSLDPSYEPDAEPAHPDHEQDFAVLQKMRAAKLIEPVDAEHMYFAAMESKGCRLTPLGRHYWVLAEGGRI